MLSIISFMPQSNEWNKGVKRYKEVEVEVTLPLCERRKHTYISGFSPPMCHILTPEICTAASEKLDKTREMNRSP